MSKHFCLLVLILFSAGATRLAPGDHLLICGDSLTAACGYSVMLEDYLVMCQPARVRITQCGEDGQAGWGFLGSIDSLAALKPTVVLTCFGMNDGWYTRYSEVTGDDFRQGQRAIFDSWQRRGVRLIVAGTAGGVDSHHYRGFEGDGAEVYNHTLGRLRDVVRELSNGRTLIGADVVSPMQAAMIAAKKRHGEDYAVAGVDGIHPGPNGQLIMAYAFLRALGCDGEIGRLKIDLASGAAEASEGHRFMAERGGGGIYSIESARYPFCFTGDGGRESAREMRAFLPFDEELNRFTLVVTNSGAPRVRITWGENHRIFSAEQLARGINLAAEFPVNPFCERFQEVHERVLARQRFDREFPDSKDGRRAEELRERVRAAFVPVKHSIRVEPVPGI